MSAPVVPPATRVRVTQTISTRDGPWRIEVEGRVLSCERCPTGSWFAHGKQDKLWLQRMRLQKDDGEIVDLVLNGNSEVIPVETNHNKK